ncbi:MAG: lysophospholipid acyltransferase family protein [Candidatus Eiseniibacteriota bacterium]|jgi:KDO2-lipid IV(A) lauroyltransferase
MALRRHGVVQGDRTPVVTIPDAMYATLGYALLRAVARRLPPRLGPATVRAGARLHYRLAADKRRAVRLNLEHVLSWRDRTVRPEAVDLLARRTFENHGRLLYEWLRDGDGVTMRFGGLGHLDRALERGRGAVICTCHLGNWEIAALELARRGYTLHVVSGEQLGRLGAAVRRHKATHGIHVVRPFDGMRKLYRALEHGEIVVLLIDGDIYSRAHPTCFFGTPTPLPLGGAHLARATGAALLPAVMVHDAQVERGYAVTVLPPVTRGRTDLETMSAVLRALEPSIASHPQQWCLFRPLWPAAPGWNAA